MDEDLFRNYFIKLYKSLALLEADYLKILSKKERNGFLVMTESLKDLASHFRCAKKHKETSQYADRPTKKKMEEVATKMIYGIGELPVKMSTCQVVPAAMGGFF